MKRHTVNEIMTREVVSVRMTAGYKDMVGHSRLMGSVLSRSSTRTAT